MVFDYTNYTLAASVKVLAVDNDVDEGANHTDWLTVNVTSADSWDACDEARRTDCGQAVAYNGFAVGVISALLDGRSPREAVRRGNLIGAKAVQVLGDMEGLPSRAQLDKLESRPEAALS